MHHSNVIRAGGPDGSGGSKWIYPTGGVLRFRRLIPLVMAALFIAAVGCGSSGSGLSGLGDRLVLSAGGSIEVDTGDERVLIQFISLDADSRCPQGAVCVVAGEAMITLGLTLEDGSRRAFPVTVPLGASVRSEVAGYALTLTNLFPDPPPQNVDEALYRAELVLTRP